MGYNSLWDFEPEPHCFVCGRHTDHFAEHDDLVYDYKVAEYGKDGSVYITDHEGLDKLRKS